VSFTPPARFLDKRDACSEDPDGCCLSRYRHVSPAGEYQTLYKSLHESIRTGKGRDALLVKPEEAALVIKVIELGMRASKEGKVLDWEE